MSSAAWTESDLKKMSKSDLIQIIIGVQSSLYNNKDSERKEEKISSIKEKRYKKKVKEDKGDISGVAAYSSGIGASFSGRSIDPLFFERHKKPKASIKSKSKSKSSKKRHVDVDLSEDSDS